jgi:hypothetical protein
MRLVLDTDRLHVPPAVRAGIVIGTAIALAGITVGGIRGSTTNQVPLVYVANPSSSPVPVSVTNQTSAQTVTGTVNVGNFPSTQPVSGTVSVANFPSTVRPAVASQSRFLGYYTIDAGSIKDIAFGGTINVSFVLLDNQGSSDTMQTFLKTPDLAGGPSTLIHYGDGGFVQTFPVAIPATGISIGCNNLIESCTFLATVVGN